jgi:hypothetical protein
MRSAWPLANERFAEVGSPVRSLNDSGRRGALRVNQSRAFCDLDGNEIGFGAVG